jgi:AraC family transcriptional regulator of adaptative response/methylated-DNA-[protein]-cysteine methyltransferase
MDTNAAPTLPGPDFFWYAVRTTGVYCRPSCAARLPLRKNVSFHASTAQAAAAGFRPCQRCRPDRPDRAASLAAAACRRLDAALAAGAPPPDLAALAAEAGLSPAHFHRMFKTAIGLTPRGYAAARRAARMRDALPAAGGVADAIYQAGYGSSRQFYAAAAATLGMPAAAYRAGGRDAAIRVTTVDCTLGALLVAATARGLCAVRLGDAPAPLLAAFRRQFSQAQVCTDNADFAALVAAVVRLVERPGQPSDLPLDIRGTAFQQRVWAALQTIPPGTTTTYTALAAEVGAPAAVRAVGAACGANPVSVVIPCHRVLRRDGQLAGYAWGLDRKAELLRREAAE